MPRTVARNFSIRVFPYEQLWHDIFIVHIGGGRGSRNCVSGAKPTKAPLWRRDCWYWRNMLLWTFVKMNRHIWLYTENIMYQKQHIVHWKHRCRVGASNTRAACGPGRDFVRPAMLFGNLQIINIYVAKCLEMRCREIIESNLNDTQCGFVPAVVIQTAFRSPDIFWEILGVC